MMKKCDRWEIEIIDIAAQKDNSQGVRKTVVLAAWLKKYWKRVIIISVIAYSLIFLFGFITTRFYTDENGVRHAYRISISDLKKQEDYEALKERFVDVRGILTEITVVDIHFANGNHSAYEAAALYTAILDERLDVAIPKISSLNVQDEQKPVKEALTSLLTNDLALYLQKIAEALKTGDSGTASTALAYREKAMSTYDIIESALAGISEELCMGDDEYYDWVLANAVAEKDPTAILRQTEGN